MTGPDAFAVHTSLRRQVLRREFRVSHVTLTEIDIVGLSLHDRDGGELGHGEISADLGYDQTGAEVRAEAESLAVRLAGVPGTDRLARLTELLRDLGRGCSGPARTLVEMALLDRAARLRGRAVWQLLGLPDPGVVRLVRTVTIGQRVPGAAGPIKLKLGGDADASVLRASIGRRWPVLLDVNRGWDRPAWLRVRELVRDLAPAILEDPTGDEALLAEIRAFLPGVPVVLDEGVHTYDDVLAAARRADGANIKVLKMGGLIPAVQALRALRAQGRTAMLGSFVEPARSIAYAAQLNGMVDWSDLDGHFWVGQDPPADRYRLDSSVPGVPAIAYDTVGPPA